jgi:hypothetical protein
MRRIISLVLIISLLAIGNVLAQRGMQISNKDDIIPNDLYRNSWALLIGINKYPNLPAYCQLNYAVNDVQALKKALIEQYGFPEANITSLTDNKATKQGITDAIGQLTDRRKIDPEDRVIIFFSGHGQTVPLSNGGEMGYILPYDAKVDINDVTNPYSYYTTCLGMDELKRVSILIPAKHVLFLMDACYSGLAVSSRSGLQPTVPDYIRKIATLKSRQIITAGLNGDKSYENPEWGHGAFTYKLLEALNTGVADENADGVITGMELATHLRNVVPNISPNQTPSYGYFEGEGEFMFLRKINMAGTLTVDSAPSGAKVSLAGKDKGRTPLKLELEPGRYMLELQEESYAGWSGEIDISNGKVTKISQQLTPNFGYLDVNVFPSGSQILVDGKVMGMTPSTLKLAKGKYRVEITNRDWKSLIREQVIIEPNKTEILTGSLEINAPQKESKLQSIGGNKKPSMGIPKANIIMARESLMLPGLGQYNSKRYISGTTFMVAELVAIISSVVGYVQYSNSLDKYNESISDYRGANTTETINANKQAMIGAHDDAVRKYRFRNTMFIATGGIWTLNVIHALIVGPGDVSIHGQSEEMGYNITPQTDSIAMLVWGKF